MNRNGRVLTIALALVAGGLVYVVMREDAPHHEAAGHGSGGPVRRSPESPSPAWST